jgi:hypothetical protein
MQSVDNNTNASLSQNVTEDDWSLPSSVQLSPQAGFYPSIFALSWKLLNPKEGVYDLTLLDSALALANRNNIEFFVVPYVADKDFVPEWVVQKHRLPSYRFPFNPDYQTQVGPLSKGYFVPIWNVGYQQELRSFLLRIVQHPFFQSPRFRFCYFPGAWRWGEFTVEFTSQMEADGLTPKTSVQAIQRLIDIFVEVFRGKESLLVWTGYDNLEYCDDKSLWRDQIGRQISQYALSKGVGVRHGGMERFNWALSDIPNWGTRLDTVEGKIYMKTDETVSILADHKRIFGSELECFGDCEGGNRQLLLGTYYHKKMAMLKALQLQIRWIDAYKEFANEYPSLYEYVKKSIGKTASTSADCWVALRAAQDDAYPHENRGVHRFTVHNWERWLYQREIQPEGKTILTNEVKDAWQPLAEPVYEARKTNHTEGSDYMYFNVDDRFVAGYTKGYILKITFADTFVGSWHVEYTARDGTVYKPSPPVNNQNDGQWKTVSLRLSDAQFSNRQKGGMDFRVYNGGKNDLTVRFIRLIKEN